MTPSSALRRRVRRGALGASLAVLASLAACAAWPPSAPPTAPQAVPEPSAPPASPLPEPAPAAAPPVPPPAPPAPAPAPAKPPPIGVIELASRAGPQALLAGLRAYEDGHYPDAEHELRAALKAGLAAPKDRAAAQKTLAFLYCTSAREAACERAFRAARAADPAFRLTKAEAGHPLWGPAYRRVLGIR